MSTASINKKSNSMNGQACTEVQWANNQSHQSSPSQQCRKQKFHKNSNRQHSNKNHTYQKVVLRDENNNEITAEPNAIVPGESCFNSTYPQDQSISEDGTAQENSEGYSPSSESNASEQPHNVYDQGLQNFSPCAAPVEGADPNCYNAGFEYDYQHTNVQQQSQYYIYQPYHDYSTVPNIAGSPLNNSFTGTPQQQQYYTAYQPIPSYIYDPQNCSYTSAYSPVQQNPHQTFHQTPGNPGTNISSPQQQQTTFLASYQTPPQPGHQLYIQTSNITPPTSLSPNDTPSTNSSATDRASDCNSPHPNGVVPSHLTQTPVHNSYVMHNPEMTSQQYTPQPQNTVYTPLTPQQYQCNSPMPTQQYMMYNPPAMSQGSPYQASQSSPMSPMVQTPYSYNNPSNFKPKNRSARFNKRNFNHKYNYAEQTPQSTYEENQYANTPASAQTFEQNLDFESSPDNQMPVYPTSSYCDPNMGMPNTEAILNAAYNYDGAIDTYGDDYGDQYDENAGEDNDENLACQVCRGRRMCFCYFLKVRYYKFPSFFDLVDHQYKKWRKTMAANGQPIPQPPFMNGQQMLNQSQSMNTSILQSPNINGNMMIQQSPHSMSNIPKNKA